MSLSGPILNIWLWASLDITTLFSQLRSKLSQISLIFNTACAAEMVPCTAQPGLCWGKPSLARILSSLFGLKLPQSKSGFLI